jgi:transcriptional regulator with XRE-family HTH domain
MIKMDKNKLRLLKIALQRHGIFQKTLAEKCGCSLSTVNHILHGRKPDSFGVLPAAGQMLAAKITAIQAVESVLEAA